MFFARVTSVPAFARYHSLDINETRRNMPNSLVIGGGALTRGGGISSRPAAHLAGANKTRQGKYDARAARRWGDWGILELPAALLWFDEACALLDDDGTCLPQAINDIWS